MSWFNPFRVRRTEPTRYGLVTMPGVPPPTPVRLTDLWPDAVRPEPQATPVLPPYTGTNGVCIKCGAIRAQTRHRDHTVESGIVYGECLLRTCVTCGYTWPEAPRHPDPIQTVQRSNRLRRLTTR